MIAARKQGQQVAEHPFTRYVNLRDGSGHYQRSDIRSKAGVVQFPAQVLLEFLP